MSENEVRLQEALMSVREGKAVLFMGAGCSLSAGAPTTEKLLDEAKMKFPKADKSLNDLLELFWDVIETPPYTRQDLELFIASKIDTLKPTEAHLTIAKQNWAAIFTTNYDDLIEQAFRSEARLRPCRSLSEDDLHVNTRDRTLTYVFRVMGYMDTAMMKSNLVLTRSDYNNSARTRQRYFEYLFDFVKDGTIIFVGYSGKDHWAFDVIDAVLAKYGQDMVPYSYALYPELPTTEKEIAKFVSRKIRPVKCSFEEFAQFLSAGPQSAVLETVPKSAKVNLLTRGFTLSMERSQLINLGQFCKLLTEQDLNEPPGKKDDFFRGTNLSWSAFKQNWDFRRDLYPQLLSRVRNELKSPEPKDNTILALVGIPGCGKSMLLRRLAFDIYTSGEAPVFLIDPTRSAIDLKMLDSIIYELNRKFDEASLKEASKARIKPLILIDDVASLALSPNMLKNYLTSRSKSCLIVCAARTADWNETAFSDKNSISRHNVFALQEELTATEDSSLADHLFKLNYLLVPSEYKQYRENEEDHSFFATIYTLVHPSRRPFNQIIRHQFSSLSELQKKAFLYVCCFHQFNLPINYELWVRALGVSYDQFREEIMTPEVDGIIFEREDKDGNLEYATHHRIIARRTIDFFLYDSDELTNTYVEIFKSVHLGVERERDLVEQLLVNFLSANNKSDSRLNLEQKRLLFSTVCAEEPVRSLLHHWGIIELELKHYQESVELLRKALETRELNYYRREESDRNILVSLGTLYSRWGMEKLHKANELEGKEKEGKEQEANADFILAQTYFTRARSVGLPNAYPYHAEALMYLRRGDEEVEEEKKVDFYSRGLMVLDVGEDNLNPEDLPILLELRTKMLANLGEEEHLVQNIERLALKYSSARGYIAISLLLFMKARYVKSNEQQKDLLTKALTYAEKGLERFPHDDDLLRLRAKIAVWLFPNSVKSQFKMLREWFDQAKILDLNLMFELGVIEFKLKHYVDYREIFKRLDKLNVGLRRRGEDRKFMTDSFERKEWFEGEIVSLENEYNGHIKCFDLDYDDLLFFRPIASLYTVAKGDLVRFNIAFSLRGAKAINVQKR